jgi:hypothetical protein
MRTLNSNTEELLGHIEWLDAINATIEKIVDDRGGSGAWIIYFTTNKGE